MSWHPDIITLLHMTSCDIITVVTYCDTCIYSDWFIQKMCATTNVETALLFVGDVNIQYTFTLHIHVIGPKRYINPYLRLTSLKTCARDCHHIMIYIHRHIRGFWHLDINVGGPLLSPSPLDYLIQFDNHHYLDIRLAPCKVFHLQLLFIKQNYYLLVSIISINQIILQITKAFTGINWPIHMGHMVAYPQWTGTWSLTICLQQ